MQRRCLVDCEVTSEERRRPREAADTKPPVLTALLAGSFLLENKRKQAANWQRVFEVHGKRWRNVEEELSSGLVLQLKAYSVI